MHACQWGAVLYRCVVQICELGITVVHSAQSYTIALVHARCNGRCSSGWSWNWRFAGMWGMWSTTQQGANCTRQIHVSALAMTRRLRCRRAPRAAVCSDTFASGRVGSPIVRAGLRGWTSSRRRLGFRFGGHGGPCHFGASATTTTARRPPRWKAWTPKGCGRPSIICLWKRRDTTCGVARVAAFRCPAPSPPDREQ